MKKTVLLLIALVLKIGGVFAQGASSAWDAQHAFDEQSGGGSSIGIGVFFVLLIVFIIVLFLWGKTMNKK